MSDKQSGSGLTPEQYESADVILEGTRFDREPANGPLQWGLTILHGDLAQMAKAYRSGEIQNQRDAVVGQLFAIQRFLRSQGINESTVEPMMRPVTALAERENNKLDPLFCERKRGGKPSRTTGDFERIGALAALADAYLELHRDEEGNFEQKLRRFARQVSCNWFGKVTYSKVKAAREMVSQEAKDHPAVTWAALYESNLEKAEALGGARTAYDAVLRFLQKHRGNY